MIKTIKEAKTKLASLGFNVIGFNNEAGRNYCVLNFRSGVCFRGDRVSFINWVNYYFSN